MDMENFKIDVDADGIALITFDVPGRSMNTLTSSVMKEIPELVERIKTDDAIKGAVITSGKASGFCAGADLGDMAGGVLSGGGDLQKAFDAGWKLNGAFRALETSGKPIAAAINGLALGGGLEFTLAAHYRVVENDNKIQLGLPEIKVGLFPGGGGTQRLTRLVGVQNAMMAMSEGKSFRPNDAKGAVALIDKLAGPDWYATLEKIYTKIIFENPLKSFGNHFILRKYVPSQGNDSKIDSTHSRVFLPYL